MPFTQPVKVAFDTGSEFLVVTSNLCDDATTPIEFQFKKVDEDKLEVQRSSEQKHKRCLNQGYTVGNSTDFHLLQDTSSNVGYGSALIQGFLTQDSLCLQQVENDSKNQT